MLAARAIAELLRVLGEVHGIAPAVLDMLDAWRETLPPAILRAVLAAYADGRDFAPVAAVLA